MPRVTLRRDNPLQPPTKDSFEAYFRASGLPIFALDLRNVRQDDPASSWLARAHAFRSIGAMAMDAQFASADIHGLYDAIIYIDKTTASRIATDRLRGLSDRIGSRIR